MVRGIALHSRPEIDDNTDGRWLDPSSLFHFSEALMEDKIIE